MRSEWIVMRQSHPFQEEMMRKTKGWPGLHSAVIALGLVAWTATAAKASPLTYTTSGQVDLKTGVSGTNVISFVPLNTQNTVDLGSGPTNVGLGNFVITPLAAGTSTTYKDTPFQISFLPASYNGSSVAPEQTLKLSGVLNGVVSGPSSSTVQATFDQIPNGLIAFDNNNSAKFSLPPGSLLLAPSTSNSGTTSTQGLITPSLIDGHPAPEPSTIALLLTTVGGLGLRRYVLSRRRQAKD
jgi:hypothetical protein